MTLVYLKHWALVNAIGNIGTVLGLITGGYQDRDIAGFYHLYLFITVFSFFLNTCILAYTVRNNHQTNFNSKVTRYALYTTTIISNLTCIIWLVTSILLIYTFVTCQNTTENNCNTNPFFTTFSVLEFLLWWVCSIALNMHSFYAFHVLQTTSDSIINENESEIMMTYPTHATFLTSTLPPIPTYQEAVVDAQVPPCDTSSETRIQMSLNYTSQYDTDPEEALAQRSKHFTSNYH